jgi:hypothetical protein
MEDFIPYNDLIKKPVVHGRREAVEALLMMNSVVGRPAIIGHKPTHRCHNASTYSWMMMTCSFWLYL